MLGAGGPSRSQGPSPEETGPRTRSGHRLGHQQPLLAEWKQKGILAPGWSGHTKSFAEFPLAPEVQWLDLEAQ